MITAARGRIRCPRAGLRRGGRAIDRGCRWSPRSTPTRAPSTSPTRTRCTSRRFRGQGPDRTPSVQIKRVALEDPGRRVGLRAGGQRRQRHDAGPRRAAARLRAGNAARSPPASAASTAARATARPSSRAGGGCRFNSPNDVVVASDGAIWFTDPSYGHLQGFQARAGGRRLRLPLRPGHGSDRGRRRRLRQAQRARLLAGRAHPVRHRQRRQPGAGQLPRRLARITSRRSTCSTAGACAGERLFAVTTPGFPGRTQGRQRRARLRVVVLRGPGVRPQRTAARRDPPARRRQLLLRRAANATSCSSPPTRRSGPPQLAAKGA